MRASSPVALVALILYIEVVRIYMTYVRASRLTIVAKLLTMLYLLTYTLLGMVSHCHYLQIERSLHAFTLLVE